MLTKYPRMLIQHSRVFIEERRMGIKFCFELIHTYFHHFHT